MTSTQLVSIQDYISYGNNYRLWLLQTNQLAFSFPSMLPWKTKVCDSETHKANPHTFRVCNFPDCKLHRSHYVLILENHRTLKTLLQYRY